MSLAALRVRPFRHLLAAYAVNQLGDWAGEVALAVVVFQTTGSPAAVATTWLVHRCLLALAAPALVAKLEHRPAARLLPRISCAQAAIFVTLAALASRAGLPLILALLAVDGLLASTARALTRTAVVAVTRPAGLHREGNALINIVFTTNGILAPAVGGVLVAALGPASALTANAGSFLLAAFALRTASLPHRRSGAEADQTRRHGGLRDSLAYLACQPLLRRLFTADAALSVLLAMILPIEVVFVTDTLGAGEAAFGAVLTAWGVGMVIGGVLLARLRRASPAGMLLAAAATQAAGMLGMGMSHAVVGVMVWSAVGGIGNGVYGMAFVTAFQERTADAYQARINGLYDTLVSVAPGLGFAAGGAVAALAGPRAVYLIAGLGCLAVTGWSTARWRALDWSIPMPAVALSLSSASSST